MSVIRIILTVVFIIVCVALTFVVLRQEGKTQGLGSIAGAGGAQTKKKLHTAESRLITFTRVLAVLFLVLAAVLNINKF